MSTLDEIRRKLQALDNKTSNKSSGSNDKLTFPHWNMPEGQSSTIRFLPDGNTDNTFFWVEKQMIRLAFPGIKGHDEHKPVDIQVPCMEMYPGESCPILNEIRPMWKDPSLEDTARKYWKKRSFIFQGFVKQNAVAEDVTPENPIRKFVITPQIFPLIKSALLDPELENLPTDALLGLDFILTKTSKGGYADYTTSKWARKESSLTTEQLNAIGEFGLVDLNEYLPKKPTPEALSAIFDMFTASIEGELYDPAKWAKFYKPYGFDSASDSDNGQVKQPSRVVSPKASTLVDDEIPFDVDEPVVTKTVDSVVIPKSETTTTVGKTPQEILSMLRNRPKS